MKTNPGLFTRFFGGSMAALMLISVRAVMADPAQGTPDQFFGHTNLYTFHLTIAPDQWAIMEQIEDVRGNPVPPGGNNQPRSLWNMLPPGPGRPRPGGPGPMMGLEFKKGTAALEFQGQRYGEIRVRFKGNSSFKSSRNSLKHSFKLDFNDLDKNQTFFGLTKLNLNNNAMDPSQLREALAYHIFRQGGVPASRTAFAQVFITVPGQYDHTYAGLYTIVEQVDENFLKDRFGTKKGMLLKPERIPGLPYWGNDWAAYTNQVQAKSKVKTEEANRFIEFVKCLNLSGQERFQAEIADYIDVDKFLRFLALQALLSNLDSPLLTGHNYYLYLQPENRKFLWLPWDMNEAFGGFNPAGSLSEQIDLSMDQCFTRVNLLAGRLLQVPGMKERYHQVVRGLLATNFNTTILFPIIDALAATVRSSLTNDPMVSPVQFEAALSESSQLQWVRLVQVGDLGARPGGLGGPGSPARPRAALKAFIRQRIASVQSQLEGKSVGYMPREIRPGPNGGPGPFRPPPGVPRW